MNLLTIFVTGLLAGGLSCLAVQGGLLASSISSQKNKDSNFVPVISFLLSRLVAYTLLGLLLGLFGSFFQLSLKLRVFLQFGVAIFMIGTALNLLQVHPIFRYFVIQPPKFLTRLVRNQSQSQSIFGPALLGALTVLIPCGATQAMMAYAITTGTPLSGALTMFTFILGTSPLFMLVGLAVSRAQEKGRLSFNKLAATAILAVAILNINNAVALTGSSYTFESIWKQATQAQEEEGTLVNEATIYFNTRGYTSDPKVITVKGGEAFKLKLVNNNGAGCIQAFTIPTYNIQKNVPMGSSTEISLDIPQVSAEIPFMCSMGMYRGVIHVI